MSCLLILNLLPKCTVWVCEAIFLPPEGIVSTTEPRSRFRFFGSLILHSCSKWVCMGPSIVRKLHCKRPLSVVAAISLTCSQRQYIPQLLSKQAQQAASIYYLHTFKHIQVGQVTSLRPGKASTFLSCCLIGHILLFSYKAL